MNYKEVKHTKERLKVGYNSNLNIQAYGENNLYPQMVARIIDASSTGGICLDRYATFIEGNGLNNVAFAEFVCNQSGATVDDVFHLIAQDMAKYHGCAIHVNFDYSFRVCSMQHVPFECCRLEEETVDGRVLFINYHPDWTGSKTRNGKIMRVDKNTVRKFYVFNPNPAVVAEQMANDGGIENYRGQILWVSLDGVNIYPKAIYDKIITNLSTDEGLDNVNYRNVRNNFLPAGMMIRKKGGAISVDDNGRPIDDGSGDAMRETLAIFQGDENTGSLLDIEINSDEDAPQFVNIEAANFDKKFTETNASTTERIYSAFGQEPFYCIRIGKTGFSGDILNDAYNYYNSYVTKERRTISRALKRIVQAWNAQINIDGDFEIQPLVLVKQ